MHSTMTDLTDSIDCPGVPHLVELGLSPDEIQALSRQGFIRRALRGRNEVFRLCYRVGGKQRSRYVPATRAAAVAADLARLQEGEKARRALRQLARTARQTLRQRKDLLHGLVEKSGFYFHGNQVRRRRTPKCGDRPNHTRSE
jgi:hypothetical protein